MSLDQLVLGPIQRFLLSEREDGLQTGGFLLAGGVIQSVSFDYLWITTLSLCSALEVSHDCGETVEELSFRVKKDIIILKEVIIILLRLFSTAHSQSTIFVTQGLSRKVRPQPILQPSQYNFLSCPGGICSNLKDSTFDVSWKAGELTKSESLSVN